MDAIKEEILTKETISEMIENTEQFIAKAQKTNSILTNKLHILPTGDFLWQQQFAVSYARTCRGFVNIFEIVGTNVDNVQNDNWLDMFLLAKDMLPEHFKQIQNNLEKYLSQKQTVSCIKINDTIFVDLSDIFQIAIAKNLCYFSGCNFFWPARIEEWNIDLEFIGLYEKLQKIVVQKELPLQISILNKRIKREDAPGWYKDYFDVRIEIVNIENRKKLVVDKENMIVLVDELQRLSRIGMLFGKCVVAKQIF